MDENRQRAYEDIACIRDVLARTAADFKGLASFFIVMGIIWCVNAVLSMGLRAWNIALTMRYIGGMLSGLDNQLFTVNALGQYKEYLFLAVMVVVYVLCRRRGMGLDAISQKLLHIWGLCLFLFIGGCLVVHVIPSLQIQMLRQGLLDERMADQKTILYGSMFVERCLNLVFPVLPVLITSVFLENRRIKILCIAAAVLVLLWIFIPGTSVSLEESLPMELLWEMLWKRGLAACIQIIPATALLAFGLNLKKT